MSQRKHDARADLTESGVLNLRDVPKDLVAKLKAAAAFAQKPLKQYVIAVLQEHVIDLEKRGTLPKSKVQA
jgi:hypothetical protein